MYKVQFIYIFKCLVTTCLHFYVHSTICLHYQALNTICLHYQALNTICLHYQVFSTIFLHYQVYNLSTFAKYLVQFVYITKYIVQFVFIPKYKVHLYLTEYTHASRNKFLEATCTRDMISVYMGVHNIPIIHGIKKFNFENKKYKK